MDAIVTTARDFSSSSLHAFRVAREASAPVFVSADGTVKSYVILGVQHHQGWTELVGWYRRADGQWWDEVLEIWDEQISDSEALTTAEVLPAPLTIR